MKPKKPELIVLSCHTVLNHLFFLIPCCPKCSSIPLHWWSSVLYYQTLFVIWITAYTFKQVISLPSFSFCLSLGRLRERKASSELSEDREDKKLHSGSIRTSNPEVLIVLLCSCSRQFVTKWLTNVTGPKHRKRNIATLSGFCNGGFVTLTLGFYSRSQVSQHKAAALNNTS